MTPATSTFLLYFAAQCRDAAQLAKLRAAVQELQDREEFRGVTLVFEDDEVEAVSTPPAGTPTSAEQPPLAGAQVRYNFDRAVNPEG